jgi:hypothetical protein
MGLLRLATLGAVGYAGYRWWQNSQGAAAGKRVAFAPGQSGRDNAVRDAGPDAIRDMTHREWTKEDQASDESFPASDPPGTY